MLKLIQTLHMELIITATIFFCFSQNLILFFLFLFLIFETYLVHFFLDGLHSAFKFNHEVLQHRSC